MTTASKASSILRLRMREPTEKNPYPLSLIVSMDDGKGEQKYLIKPTTPFKPYTDTYIDMAYDPYKGEVDIQMNDFLIENLVNKIITNQAVSLAEGKDYYEDFENTFYDEDKVPAMYKTRSNSGFYFNDKTFPKKKKENAKRGRKKKVKAEENQRLTSASGEFPIGSEQFVRADGTKMVSLTVNMMRQYMFTETDARIRHINDYYQRQWAHVNRERMQALADLIKSQETTQKLKEELDEVTNTLEDYKLKCSSLGQKVNSSKEAKKRRRQAKKQRQCGNARDADVGDLNKEPTAEGAPQYPTYIEQNKIVDESRRMDTK